MQTRHTCVASSYGVEISKQHFMNYNYRVNVKSCTVKSSTTVEKSMDYGNYLFVCLFVFKAGFLCVTAVLELVLVDQAGLELIEIPTASASGVLGLRACATTTWSSFVLLKLLSCIIFIRGPSPKSGPCREEG